MADLQISLATIPNLPRLTARTRIAARSADTRIETEIKPSARRAYERLWPSFQRYLEADEAKKHQA